MEILKRIFLCVIVLMVIQQCDAMRFFQTAKTKFGKNYKTGQKRFYSRTNFKNWFNRFKKPQLSRTQKAVGLTTAGATAVATYTWWDKIKEFFGYNPYSVEKSEDYKFGKPLNTAEQEKIKNELAFLEDLKIQIYNKSVTKNGYKLEFFHTHYKKNISYFIVVLKNLNDEVISKNVFLEKQPDRTVKLVLSTLTDNKNLDNIPVQERVLLEYAERELKNEKLHPVEINAIEISGSLFSKKTLNLLEKLGYEKKQDGHMGKSLE